MTNEDRLAEKWLDERYLKDMGVRKPCKRAYLAGAEPREKRIAELEAIARNTKATDESFALLTIQLIEAKKIIRSLLTCCRNYPQENAEKMRQAEKFIKDSEVVK